MQGFRGMSSVVALAVVGGLGACKTIPLNPGTYRPDVVPFDAQPSATPIALMINTKDGPEANFVSYQFVKQAAKIFQDRVVVFDEKAAQARSLIVLEDVTAKKVDGFFNDDHIIDVKGYVQRAGGPKIPLQIQHTGSTDVSKLAVVAPLFQFGLMLMAVPPLWFYITSWLVFPLVYGSYKIQDYYQNEIQFEEHEGLDRACSGAVVKFLNAAHQQLDGPTAAPSSVSAPVAPTPANATPAAIAPAAAASPASSEEKPAAEAASTGKGKKPGKKK